MEQYRNGDLRHGYTVKPMPRQIQEFEKVIADSFRKEATFMNALLLARFFPNRSLVIHNMTVIESEGTTSNLRTLANQDDLVQAVFEYFGIPGEITKNVVNEMENFGNAWG